VYISHNENHFLLISVKKAASQYTPVNFTRHIYYSRADTVFSKNIQFSLLSHGNLKRIFTLRRRIALHKKPELTPFIYFIFIYIIELEIVMFLFLESRKKFFIIYFLKIHDDDCWYPQMPYK